MRDAGLCGICHQPIEPETASIDHVIPFARGGPDHISNMQLAHGACNSRKWATIPITAIYDFVPRLESGQPDTEPDPPAAEFIDANEAATLLGIKPASVRYRCERGLFAGAINAGGRVWLIPRPTVAAASTVGRLRPGPKRKPRRQPP